jgi:ribonuclease E
VPPRPQPPVAGPPRPQPQGQPLPQEAGGEGGEGGEGGGRRRRRRRRRGGRGRNRDRQEPFNENGAAPVGGVPPIPPGQEDVDAETMSEAESVEPRGEYEEAQDRGDRDQRDTLEDDREGRGADEAPPEIAEAPAPVDDQGPTEPLGEEPEAKPKGRRKASAARGGTAAKRGTRGGRGRGKKAAASEDAVEQKSGPKAEIAEATAAEQAGRAKTGSVDRHHLIVEEEDEEEPLTPTPRPPRTYRDLDEIPDDFE